MSTLKPELKKIIIAVQKNEGLPPIIDKTFLDLWTTFAKSQPNQLNTTTKIDPDVWGSLKANIIKYVNLNEALTEKVVKQVKAKFGEAPSPQEIKAFMA